MKIDKYVQVIEAAYPALRITGVRPVNEEGQYNDAIVVNECLIVRFPRYLEGIEMMRREVAFLQAARGRTSLPVPDPTYAMLEADTPGEVFMGYPLIPGEPLWRPTILAEKEEQVLDMWAEQLARFLRELHALPAADFADGRSAVDSPAEWENLYSEIRTHLFPLMRFDAREGIVDHFESFLNEPALHHYQPAPRHGDYGSGNILTDPTTKRITGIIDFGFAAVGDPAIDIAAASTLGEALFGRFAKFYPGMEAMMPRARFYRGTYALFEALHGFKSGDQDAFEVGMEKYI